MPSWAVCCHRIFPVFLSMANTFHWCGELSLVESVSPYWPVRNVCLGSLEIAVVTKIRSPHTMGDESASPGISTLQTMLVPFVASHFTGGLLGPIGLWSPDNPKLYKVQATVSFPGLGSHVLTRQIGFREASFRPDGFHLNGQRLQLFGLDRHQLYPYAGMAMPARVQRKDVEIQIGRAH